MRIKTQKIIDFGILIFIVLASFLSPLQENLNQNEVFLLFTGSLLLVLFGLIKMRYVKFTKIDFRLNYLWIFLLICFLYRNAYLKHNNLVYFATGFYSIVYVFCLTVHSNWQNMAVKAIAYTSFIHVTATIVFFIFPGLWDIYSSVVFDRYIAGTSGGFGYKAALNGHYSTNGTMTAFAALSVMAMILTLKYNRKNYYKYFSLLILAIAATLLTTKRAHILFLGLAFLTVYFLLNWKKEFVMTIIKIVSIIVVSVIIISILIKYVPALSAVFSRFKTAGVDTQTLTRFTMWEYAIKLFKQHWLIGNGWGYYRYAFEELEMYEGSANAHNIYLQLLSETGVLGLIVFLVIAIISIYRTIKCIAKIYSNSFYIEYKTNLIFALLFQVFFLLYGFTGNPLYDFCFIYYSIAVAITNSFIKKVYYK